MDMQIFSRQLFDFKDLFDCILSCRSFSLRKMFVIVVATIVDNSQQGKTKGRSKLVA